MIVYKPLTDDEKVNVVRQFMLNDAAAFVVANNMDVETFNMLLFLYNYNYIKDSDLKKIYSFDADPIDQLDLVARVHTMYKAITENHNEMNLLTYEAYVENKLLSTITPALQESFDKTIPMMIITKLLSNTYDIISKVHRNDFTTVKDDTINKLKYMVYGNNITDMVAFKNDIISDFTTGIANIDKIFQILDIIKVQYSDLCLSKVIDFEDDDSIKSRLNLSELEPNNNLLYYNKPVVKRVFANETPQEAMKRFGITIDSQIRTNDDLHAWEVYSDTPGYIVVNDFTGNRLEHLSEIIDRFSANIVRIIPDFVGFDVVSNSDTYVYTLNKSDIHSLLFEDYEFITFPVVSRVMIDDKFSYMFGAITFGRDNKTTEIYPSFDLDVVYPDNDNYIALMKLSEREQYEKVKLEALKTVVSVQKNMDNTGFDDLLTSDGKTTINGINIDIKFTNDKLNKVTFDVKFSADGVKFYKDEFSMAFPPLAPLTETYATDGTSLEYSEKLEWKVTGDYEIRQVPTEIKFIHDEARRTILKHEKFIYTSDSNVFIDTMFTFLKLDIYKALYEAHRAYLTDIEIDRGITYKVNDKYLTSYVTGNYTDLMKDGNSQENATYYESKSIVITDNILVNKELEELFIVSDEIRNNFTAI